MFDHSRSPRRRVAIIGGGISGLSAAYYLSANCDVTLYEAEPRLGGHARTVMAGKNGDQPVDTGFIVFNYATYPYLTGLFRELNVPVIKSKMSFGASIDNGRVEYGLETLKTLIAQKRNLLRPAFYKMIRDILHFGKHAETTATDDEMTIGELIAKLRLGTWFREYYLLPMCGAIWSTPTEDIDQFPARSLIRFFRNHALLSGTGQHQWFTVEGGSIEYVRRLQTALMARGVILNLAAPVHSVTRSEKGSEIVSDMVAPSQFDDVIFACHSDQALRILGEDATPLEREALSSIRYQDNRAVLHADPGHMPNRKEIWSSWSYLSQKGAIGVTYWMNNLQAIPESDPLFVTLNPSRPIDPKLIYDDVSFAHPVFDGAALKSQKTLQGIQGENNTWFAGAYHRHGFHEDGIASAMRVVRAIEKRDAFEVTAHQNGQEKEPDIATDRGERHETDGQSTENTVSVDLRAPA